MSVLKSLRNLSDMEFYKNAKVLRNEVTGWMLRNFGAKYKLKDVKILAKNISDVDKNKIYEILEPYDLNDNKAFNLAVPDWFYDMERNIIQGLTREIIRDIIKANEIYVKEQIDYSQRREYQNKAITGCFDLYSELDYISSFIPMNLNQLIKIFELLDKEIELLRKWKSSTTKYWNKERTKSEKVIKCSNEFTEEDLKNVETLLKDMLG